VVALLPWKFDYISNILRDVTSTRNSRAPMFEHGRFTFSSHRRREQRATHPRVLWTLWVGSISRPMAPHKPSLEGKVVPSRRSVCRDSKIVQIGQKYGNGMMATEANRQPKVFRVLCSGISPPPTPPRVYWCLDNTSATVV
jgi:hypothetical protein